jgi:cytochrome c-type biogenesis protein
VQTWLSRIGGIIVIFFGLYLTGLINVGWLDRNHAFTVKRGQGKWRYATSFLFGIAFAAGWTPCAGAVLGAILGLAASAPVSSFFLLFSYALGLGLPFLVVAAFTAQATNAIARYGNALKYVNVIFGVLLIGLGVLVFTQDITLIGNFSFVNNLFLQ